MYFHATVLREMSGDHRNSNHGPYDSETTASANNDSGGASAIVPSCNTPWDDPGPPDGAALIGESADLPVMPAVPAIPRIARMVGATSAPLTLMLTRDPAWVIPGARTMRG